MGTSMTFKRTYRCKSNISAKKIPKLGTEPPLLEEEMRRNSLLIGALWLTSTDISRGAVESCRLIVLSLVHMFCMSDLALTLDPLKPPSKTNEKYKEIKYQT